MAPIVHGRAHAHGHADGCAHARGSDPRPSLTVVGPAAVLGLPVGARDAHEIRCQTGGDGGEDAGERPDNRQDRVSEGIGQADEVDPGLGGGHEESNGCTRGGALTAQPEGGRDDATGTERQWNSDRRSPEHRFHLAGSKKSGEQALGDEDGEDPGQQKAEQQEDGRLLQDVPDFEQDLK